MRLEDDEDNDDDVAAAGAHDYDAGAGHEDDDDSPNMKDTENIYHPSDLSSIPSFFPSIIIWGL